MNNPNYITIKNNLIKIVGDGSLGLFRISGYQSQSEQIEDITENNQLVSIYIKEIDIPRNSSSQTEFTTDLVIQIDFLISAASSGDLSALDNSNDPEEIAQAISDLKIAENIVDDKADLLFWNVFRIIMNNKNRDLGMEELGGRWMGNFSKNDISRRGSLVTISATSRIEIRSNECTTGDDGIPAYVGDLEVDPGDNSKTGIKFDMRGNEIC